MLTWSRDDVDIWIATWPRAYIDTWMCPNLENTYTSDVLLALKPRRPLAVPLTSIDAEIWMYFKPRGYIGIWMCR